MERNRGADEFVNCVVHRGDRDMIIKPWLFIASLLVPLIYGAAMTAWILWSDTHSGGVHFPADSYDGCIRVLVISAFATEAALSSFMMFCVARRNRNHLGRDAEWMSALCDYVESKGGNAIELRKTARKCSSIIGGPVTKISMIVWILLVLTIVVLGIWFHQLDPGTGNEVPLAVMAFNWTPVFFLLIVQFALTFGSVLGFPARHDKVQTDFTKELEKQCARFGLRIEPMEHKVLRRDIWIHAILLILTLGLYSFAYLFVSCREMNAHLVEQWAYEEELMRRIIEFEGGTGIETCDEGSGRVTRILGNLM